MLLQLAEVSVAVAEAAASGAHTPRRSVWRLLTLHTEDSNINHIDWERRETELDQAPSQPVLVCLQKKQGDANAMPRETE